VLTPADADVLLVPVGDPVVEANEGTLDATEFVGAEIPFSDAATRNGERPLEL
jgi:hypothetical protein